MYTYFVSFYAENNSGWTMGRIVLKSGQEITSNEQIEATEEYIIENLNLKNVILVNFQLINRERKRFRLGKNRV